MKQTFFLILFVFTVVSCRKTSKIENSLKVSEVCIINDSASVVNDSIEEDATDSDFEMFYVVQVAEGNDFKELREIAEQAAELLHSKVDMEGKIYKQGKGIIVPEDSDDEMYRGEYYPRRPFSDQDFLSIEMAAAYKKNEKDTLKMIVVANIFENMAQSDSVVRLLLPKFKDAKTLKSELYMGCMH